MSKNFNDKVATNKPTKGTNREEPKDLGFGSVVAEESRQRLLNADGSFNVKREGLRFWSSLSLYHSLLTTSWTKFLSLVVISYFSINIIFALTYLLCGKTGLNGLVGDTVVKQFAEAFFFSVQTFSTIGYGHVNPASFAANIIVVIEALVGLLWVAMATGLLFARFSRPSAKIIFSKFAIIAPYRNITAFEFRITNGLKNQLIELEAKVLLAQKEQVNGKKIRRFYELNLERHKVVFFPLSWTIVHPIDETSPLYQYNAKKLLEVDAEFLILLTGIDETFSQTVHSRSSYKASEVLWNVKFADIFNRNNDDNQLTIDVSNLHKVEKLPATNKNL
ncbi:MAG: ion channel [Blastocatellia bacterium]